MSLHNLQEALDFAIAREQEAANLYHQLVAISKNPRAKELFQQLEQVELKHKHDLENFNLEAYQNRSQELTLNLTTTDFLLPVPKEKENFTFQEGIILAAKREEKAVRLYETLANRFGTHPGLQEFFLTLADEEKRHKHSLDALYDDEILKDN